ncbi:MAG: amino acid permease [Candidatus Hydrogenedentes bacterium]|nr:amino acid permease [Candidatus Hydrogenedentota bacterium]
MTDQHERSIGYWGATGIGVGAIVGGGILALTGVAFATAGPGAILAFIANGVLALLTALSFAEVSSKFPQSGGTYVFAQKVLTIEAAFVVGWVVWFASIAAAVLYAIGFATFANLFIDELLLTLGTTPPAWLDSRVAIVSLSLLATAFYMLSLMRKAGGGGQWINVAKVIVFAILIAGGLAAIPRHEPASLVKSLQPLLPFGTWGLLQAMGFTFIALQGFDLIAAVAGDVRDPAKNLPRAMFTSLGIALSIYIPLLLIVATVGMSGDTSIVQASQENPEGVIAVAARNYLGNFGYWLVICAGLLSMLSGLQANVLAAAHVARAMALDHSLPRMVALLNPARRTPVTALLLTGLLVMLIIVLIPTLEAAGAATSLIFLVSFALVHWICILVRQRSAHSPPPFRMRFYPAAPIIGGTGCLALAIFQGFVVPRAGMIAVVWIGLGVLLFLILFARGARIADASAVALDPEAAGLRGRSPLVLAPIANPRNAAGLVAVANAMASPRVGRVLLLSVVKVAKNWMPDDDPAPLENAQSVLKEALGAALHRNMSPETLITVAEKPWDEIRRVAALHGCESLVLGLSELDEDTDDTPVNQLMNTVDSDIIVLRAAPGWQPRDVRRILVPVAGRGGHDTLLARLLGNFRRHYGPEITFLRILPAGAADKLQVTAQRQLELFRDDLGLSTAEVLVMTGDSAIDIIAERAEESDLLVLGARRVNRRQKAFGSFTFALTRKTRCPMILVSRRR